MNVDWSNSYIQYTYINLVKLRSLWWCSGYVAMKFVAGLHYLASCHHHRTLTIIIFDLFSNIIVVNIRAISKPSNFTFKTLSIYMRYQKQIPTTLRIFKTPSLQKSKELSFTEKQKCIGNIRVYQIYVFIYLTNINNDINNGYILSK